MLKQLSIFAENIKGKMQQVTGILLEEDINILGSVTNDSAEVCNIGWSQALYGNKKFYIL